MVNKFLKEAFAILLTVGVSAAHLTAAEPPVIPVGADAYKMWDRWPYQRIGARAYMRRTYDRQGGNHMVRTTSYKRPAPRIR